MGVLFIMLVMLIIFTAICYCCQKIKYKHKFNIQGSSQSPNDVERTQRMYPNGSYETVDYANDEEAFSTVESHLTLQSDVVATEATTVYDTIPEIGSGMTNKSFHSGIPSSGNAPSPSQSDNIAIENAVTVPVPWMGDSENTIPTDPNTLELSNLPSDPLRIYHILTNEAIGPSYSTVESACQDLDKIQAPLDEAGNTRVYESIAKSVLHKTPEKEEVYNVLQHSKPKICAVEATYNSLQHSMNIARSCRDTEAPSSGLYHTIDEPHRAVAASPTAVYSSLGMPKYSQTIKKTSKSKVSETEELDVCLAESLLKQCSEGEDSTAYQNAILTEDTSVSPSLLQEDTS